MRTWQVADNVIFATDLSTQTRADETALPKTAITADSDEGTYVFGVPTPKLAQFIVDACNAAEARLQMSVA